MYVSRLVNFWQENQRGSLLIHVNYVPIFQSSKTGLMPNWSSQ